MFDKQRYEHLLQEIEEFTDYAHEMFDIYDKVNGAHQSQLWTLIEFDTNKLTFETFYRGEAYYLSMPTRYLWSQDPQTDMQADYDERTRKQQEKEAAEEEKVEAAREESERNLLKQLIQRYGVPEGEKKDD